MHLLADTIDLGNPPADELYHHITKVVVYSGDDAEINDAVEITQDRADKKLNVRTKNPQELDTVGNRPRELNIVLELDEENGESKILHLVFHKGQLFYEIENKK